MKYWVELIMLVLIFGITEYHAQLFKKNKQISALFHFIWAAVYVIPALYISIIMFDNWYLLGALFLERFVFYNPMLNLMRNKEFFYLSVSSVNASWWDHLEIGWQQAYPKIWVLSAMGFIIIQFYL